MKCGKEHVFVGMNISFIGDNKVKRTTKNYLEEVIQAFGEDVSVGAAVPANRNLFVLNEDLPLLVKQRFFIMCWPNYYMLLRGPGLISN